MKKILTLGTLIMAMSLPLLTYAETTERSRSLILSVAGVMNSQLSEIRNNQEQSSVNVGGGALLEFGLADFFGVETGVLLLNRQYDLASNDLRLVQEVRRLHLPVLARFWPTDFLSAGIGPFMAFKAGGATTTLEVGDTNVASINTSAGDMIEFGVDLALTLNFTLSNKTGLFAEGRYSTLFGQELNEDASQVSALTGIKLDI